MELELTKSAELQLIKNEYYNQLTWEKSQIGDIKQFSKHENLTKGQQSQIIKEVYNKIPVYSGSSKIFFL